MKNAYDKSQTANDTNSSTIEVGLPDMFALRAFNRLAYDCKISGPLVASTLLGLPDHYTLLCNIKSINIGILCDWFPELALRGYNQDLNEDDIVRLRRQTNTPSTIFDHYSAQGTRLQKLCLYVYVRVINIIPRRISQKSDMEFGYDHK